jgi:hypothetical protein
MRKHRAAFTVSKSALENEWQRQTTAAAIASAKQLIGEVIPSAVPVGRLSDHEWGHIVAAILFGWIETRARQATAEGEDIERAMRTTSLQPDPWDSGAVVTILPELAEACSDLDWSLPVGEWPQQAMVEFLLTAMKLVKPSMDARDLSERGITQEATHSELNDEIPF